jgi:hypothetical protein
MPRTFLAQAYDLNDPMAEMHKLCFSGMSSSECHHALFVDPSFSPAQPVVSVVVLKRD